MKTEYEKRAKFGLSEITFGKIKKKDRWLMWILIAVLFIINFISL